jgi:release factor glutamine methyltransferase
MPHDYGVSPTVEDTPEDELLATTLAINDAVGVLSRAGVGSPRVDAELLAAHALGVPRGRLALVPAMTPPQARRFRDLLIRRAARIPLQHLVGTAPFYGLEVAVGPGVFVPRPETELLVEWGLRVLPGGPTTVVDLCSGSGAIALAVVHERPQATVYAVERAPDALDWLRRNAIAAARGRSGDWSGPPRAARGPDRSQEPEVKRPDLEGFGQRIEIVAGDATDPAVLSSLDGQVDLVLCNPPYVPAGTPVAPEVARHDPYDAVFAGPGGLDVIAPLVARVAAMLRPGGWFGVEHDDSHEAAVPALLRADRHFTEVADHRDLAGRPRFATARRLADFTS